MLNTSHPQLFIHTAASPLHQYKAMTRHCKAPKFHAHEFRLEASLDLLECSISLVPTLVAENAGRLLEHPNLYWP